MNKEISYTFNAKIWTNISPNSWHFVSLPNDFSKEIRLFLKSDEEGWGRLKAIAKIGTTEWKTAIWFDTKHQTYLLPLKSSIRKTEKLIDSQIITITIWL